MQHLQKKVLCNFQESTYCGGVFCGRRAWGQGWTLEGALCFRAHGAGALKDRTLSVGTTMNGGDLAETPKINKETL